MSDDRREAPVVTEGDGDGGDPLVGKVIAKRYEISAKLGAGGMGAVYAARQLSMDRQVAIKLLHAHYTANKQAAARFDREMQVTAKIEHPNTIRVYDYGQTEDERLFLAMEFLHGKTLSDSLADGEPLALERLVHIGSQIGKALAAAHSDGVVHRDLKPDNVMLLDRYGERDFVKVLDFGIARFLDDGAKTQLTADGAVVGTPAYMSPEQATGSAIDHRTDIYSFGVMLFEMATGRVPFDAPTTISLMVKHVQDPPPRPSELAPGLIPDRIETLIMSMLAKDPAARPQSAADVVEVLERAREPAPQLLAAATRVGGDAVAEPGVAADTAQQRGGSACAAAPASHPPSPAAGRGGGRNKRLRLAAAAAAIIAAGVLGAALAVGGAEDVVEEPPRVAAAADARATEPAAADAHGASPRREVDATAIATAEHGGAEDVAVAAGGPLGAAAGADAAIVVAKGGDAEAPQGRERAAGRVAVDRAIEGLGDPLPPERCRTYEAAVTEPLGAALELLEGGSVAGTRDQDAQALAILEQSQGPAASSAEFWLAMARARLFAGDKPATALESASKAVALCGSWAAAHNAVGNAHLRLGNAHLARSSYLRAADLDVAYVAPRFNLGVVALRAGDLEAAILAFTKVVGRAPEHPNARMLRGQAYLNSGQLDRAVADFKAETERHSTQPRAWLLLGQAQTRAGEQAAARVAFCKAKELGADVADDLCPE